MKKPAKPAAQAQPRFIVSNCSFMQCDPAVANIARALEETAKSLGILAQAIHPTGNAMLQICPEPAEPDAHDD